MSLPTNGTEIVINTTKYGVSESWATQITLPNGKYAYTGVGSMREREGIGYGLECKVVRYYGSCTYCNIYERAHLHFPIQIDGVSVADFLDRIASDEETEEAFAALREGHPKEPL